MLASIVARSIRLAARWSVRILAAAVTAVVIAAIVGGLVGYAGLSLLGGAVDSLVTGSPTGADVGRLLTIGLPAYVLVLMVQAWAQLVPVRAATGHHRLADSLLGALPGALRALPLFVLLMVLQLVVLLLDPSGLLALVAIVLLIVPTLVAVGTLALDPGRWGLGDFVRLGLLRVHRHVGATIGVLLVVAFALALAAVFSAATFTVLVGPVPFDDLADPDVVTDYLDRAPAATFLAWLVGALPLLLLMPALVVATWQVVREGPTTRADDAAEDDEPIRPADELSPAVRQLLGTPAIRSQRLVVPPRAAQEGRVPGPGVMQVAGVDLPPGRHTRPVTTSSLELDSRDGEPGDDPSRNDRLWIASRPSADAPTTWKRLAAGFAESGLWPLLVPGGTVPVVGEWFDQPAVELPGRDEIDAGEVVRTRLASSLAGSPLAGTERLATSAAAAGTLTLGTGRRADALTEAAAVVGPARLALAPGRRPADVLARLAWPGAEAAGIAVDELVELVASWEARWGALLVALDARHLTFAVLRPPATEAEGLEALAEHHALCPDEAYGWGDERRAAASLVERPVWQFGWR